MVPRCSLLLLFALALPARAGDPASALSRALTDVRRLPADRKVMARYLALWHLDARGQADWEKVLRFWTRALDTASTRDDPVALARVAPGLWRVFLDEVGWKRQTWEKLLEAPEPYLHVETLVTKQAVEAEARWEDARHWDGYQWQTTRRHVPAKVVTKQVKVAAAAPWLPAAEIAGLITLTQSQIPVVRADWFLHQTGTDLDRVAGYSAFLNLGDREEDFQALVGVDPKAARRVRRELRAMIGRSGVTLQNREIEFFQGLTGGYYRSLDYAKSVDKQNILRLLDGDARPDATEQFGVLPNGLFAYWLGNGQGIRQNAAPDNIASDGTAQGTDRRVVIKGCVICHQEGLRPVNNWARTLYQPPFSLDSPDFLTQKRLRQVYLGDMTRQIARDNEAYAEALKAVNGLTPSQNAKAFGEAWYGYELADLGLEASAAEVGLAPPAWLDRLRAAAKAGKKLDPVLAGLVQGLPVRREHWEEIFPQAMEIARAP